MFLDCLFHDSAVKASQGSEIVRIGFCPADKLYRAILVEQQLGAPQLAIVLEAATINIYKSIQNYTYLHYDVPRKTSSCFIVSDFAAPKNRLLSFDITLCRLKFPSSDRYTFRFPFMWKFLNFLQSTFRLLVNCNAWFSL